MSVRQVFQTSLPAFNAVKFHLQLLGAGLNIEGVVDMVSTGQGQVAVDFVEQPTSQQLDTVATLLAQHDPVDYASQVMNGAAAQAANIPQWASWTEAQALSWHDTNIGSLLPVANLAQANSVLAAMNTELRALIRMVIALRNYAFPRLQGNQGSR